jgi:hypothetical protein
LAGTPGECGGGLLTFILPVRTMRMSTKTKPFLIQKDEEGSYRLTVRDTRYNSQGYPIVTSSLQAESFKTLTLAKAFARENFHAEAGEYATK